MLRMVPAGLAAAVPERYGARVAESTTSDVARAAVASSILVVRG